MQYIDILVTFFKIGLISFGGGYSMLPIIGKEVQVHQWLSDRQFTDVIAVSAMSPGPIASNSATMIGYSLDNVAGALLACIGVTLPSLIIILILGKLLFKYQDYGLVKAVFYGLKPTITALIIYAVIKFTVANGIIGGQNIVDVKSVIVGVLAFGLMLKTKAHPLYIILGSGIAGLFLF